MASSDPTERNCRQSTTPRPLSTISSADLSPASGCDLKNNRSMPISNDFCPGVNSFCTPESHEFLTPSHTASGGVYMSLPSTWVNNASLKINCLLPPVPVIVASIILVCQRQYLNPFPFLRSSRLPLLDVWVRNRPASI